MINIDFGFRLGNDLNGVGFSLNISILPILFHCLNQIFLWFHIGGFFFLSFLILIVIIIISHSRRRLVFGWDHASFVLRSDTHRHYISCARLVGNSPEEIWQWLALHTWYAATLPASPHQEVHMNIQTQECFSGSWPTVTLNLASVCVCRHRLTIPAADATAVLVSAALHF